MYGFSHRKVRPATNRLYDLLEQGLVTHEQVVDMCLFAMSERDVAQMVDANELSERFFETEEDAEDPLDDFNYVGSRHHY